MTTTVQGRSGMLEVYSRQQWRRVRALLADDRLILTADDLGTTDTDLTQQTDATRGSTDVEVCHPVAQLA